ncbi:MAG: ATP-binding cassette domain-containing protein [Dechloromonas sp.]|nr:ATP-binding cassette domain-containing protein [Dechloromonas sp.]MBN8555671.1 ATP-binding cassette domain-containing protein [Deltaproteobacteria bacterium]
MSVQFKNLELNLGKFHLGPLNFESASSGIHLIKGANGTGKTSLLRILMSRTAPTAGEIMGAQMEVGVVGVEPWMMGSWTVKENIEWFSQLLGRKPTAQNLEKISKFYEQRFDRLSLGQRRQVELSFALAMNFKILLLDEPLSPLDHEQRKIYSDLITQAATQNLIFITTHQENEFSDKAAKVLSL